MQLKVYKLTELAKLEGIHYQTAVHRAAKEKYICIVFDVSHPGKWKTQAKRYLPLEDSKKILDALKFTAPKIHKE